MNSSPYRFLKWTWLWSQSLMPVLAAFYLSGPSGASLLSLTGFRAFLFAAGGTCTLILWLIAESVLMMARFPLKTSEAIQLVAGFMVQFLVLVWTGGSVGFSAFVYIYITLAALAGCFLLMLGYLTFRDWSAGQRSWKWPWVAAFLVAVVLSPLTAFFPALRAGFQGQGRMSLLANSAVLFLNTGITIRALIDVSIFGRPDPQKDEYYKEWERWAAPTIILLILSVTAAIVVVGVRRSMR